MIELLKSHVTEASVLAVLAFLANVWRGLPPAWRAGVEKRFPRPVGLVRALYEASPSLVGVVLAIWFQVINGRAKADVQKSQEAPK